MKGTKWGERGVFVTRWPHSGPRRLPKKQHIPKSHARCGRLLGVWQASNTTRHAQPGRAAGLTAAPRRLRLQLGAMCGDAQPPHTLPASTTSTQKNVHVHDVTVFGTFRRASAAAASGARRHARPAAAHQPLYYRTQSQEDTHVRTDRRRAAAHAWPNRTHITHALCCFFQECFFFCSQAAV